jgi:hypothetical protein
MNHSTVSATETPCPDDDFATIAEACGFSLGEFEEACADCLKVAGGDTEVASGLLTIVYAEILTNPELADEVAKYRAEPVDYSPYSSKALRRQQVTRPPTPRPATRSRVPRHSLRRGTVKTAQDPGDPDPDHDPVGVAIERLLDSAPPFSVGQRQLLARILGGA